MFINDVTITSQGPVQLMLSWDLRILAIGKLSQTPQICIDTHSLFQPKNNIFVYPSDALLYEYALLYQGYIDISYIYM